MALVLLTAVCLCLIVAVAYRFGDAETERHRRDRPDATRQNGEHELQNPDGPRGAGLTQDGMDARGRRYGSVSTSTRGAAEYVSLDVRARSDFWVDCEDEVRPGTRALLVAVGADLEGLLAQLPKPERVEFMDIRCELTVRAARLLVRMAGLRALNLSSVSDEAVSNLPVLNSLTYLSLNARELRQPGHTLEPCPSLQTLILFGADLSSCDTTWLSGASGLRRIELHDCTSVSAALSALPRLGRLERAEIYARDSIGAEGFDALFACASLTRLVVDGIAPESQRWQRVRSNRKLAYLDLVGASFNADLSQPLAKLVGLRQLHLEGSVWKGVVNLPSTLRVLSLPYAEFGDVQGVALAECAELESLNLRGSGVSNATGAVVSSLRSLQKLDLSGCRIDGAFLRQLPPSLSWLNLSRTRIDDSDLRALSVSAPQLSTLLLGRTGVTRDGILSLADLPRLKNVGISGLDLSKPDRASLRKRFRLLED